MTIAKPAVGSVMEVTTSKHATTATVPRTARVGSFCRHSRADEAANHRPEPIKRDQAGGRLHAQIADLRLREDN